MNLKKTMFVMSLLTALSFNVNACPTFNASTEFKKFYPSDGSEAFKTHQKLLRIYARFNKLLPRPAPAEIQWLNGELNAGGKRALNAYDSKIGSLKFAVDHTEEILHILTVMQMKGLDDVKTWNQLSLELLNSNYTKSVYSLFKLQVINATDVGYYENDINFGHALYRCSHQAKDAAKIVKILIEK